jgi:hypothetical protein
MIEPSAFGVLGMTTWVEGIVPLLVEVVTAVPLAGGV